MNIETAIHNELVTILKAPLGVSVSIIRRKQNEGKSIVSHCVHLMVWANQREYKDCYRNRFFRNQCIAGLRSTKLITA